MLSPEGHSRHGTRWLPPDSLRCDDRTGGPLLNTHI